MPRDSKSKAYKKLEKKRKKKTFKERLMEDTFLAGVKPAAKTFKKAIEQAAALDGFKHGGKI